MTDSEKLRRLADWFDRSPKTMSTKNGEVQRDLRRIADDLERQLCQVTWQSFDEWWDKSAKDLVGNIMHSPIRNLPENVKQSCRQAWLMGVKGQPGTGVTCSRGHILTATEWGEDCPWCRLLEAAKQVCVAAGYDAIWEVPEIEILETAIKALDPEWEG